MIDWHDVFDSQHAVEQRWHVAPDGQSCDHIGVAIGTTEHVIKRKEIAQRSDVTGNGAVAERNEYPGPAADQPNLSEVIRVGDCAFDKCDIDRGGKLLDVHDGRVAEIDHAGQIDQVFVEIEKGHVTTGAAAEPGGCEARESHIFPL
jgi:hypothetical protein